MKKTLVIGASTNEERYSYKCIDMLRENNIETVALGRRVGKVLDVEISSEMKSYTDIDTVAVYMSAKNLKAYEDYIVNLRPRRVLFPPGTENPDFEARLTKEKIEHEQSCPLVMLATKIY